MTITPAEETEESPSASGASGASGPSGSAAPEETESAAPPTVSERLGIDTGWGPGREQLDRAARQVRRLSLRELAAQLVVPSYSGTSAPVDLASSGFGGVIAFEENVTSADQIKQSNAELQEAAQHPWPMLIGVDQEGGIVSRVGDGVTPYPTFMTAGAGGAGKPTKDAMWALGSELSEIGFNVDFAPDGDVTSGPEDPTIGSRSAGSTPALVGRAVSDAVRGFTAGGVLPVVKHFPGHGSVPADSHETLPVQERSLGQLERVDMEPFALAVERGVPSIMVGHIDVQAIDPGVPSSLSRKVITRQLRKKLGFDGLVVTDALNMAGVANSYDSGESAVRAVEAGADVLLMPADPYAARDALVEAVVSGEMTRTRLERSATRMVAAVRHAGTAKREAPDTAGAVQAWSAAGMTVASGPCRGRLVGDSVYATGDSEAVEAFNAAAEEAGLETGGGDEVSFVGYGGSSVTADVAVAVDTPYVLGDSDAPVKIAAYGSTEETMKALVQVLLGQRSAPGRLPVEVNGVDRPGC